MPDNDNDENRKTPAPRPADAHGQAALILVESLIHGLIARSVLTTQQSLDIVTSAAEVQVDFMDVAEEARPEMTRSHVLLTDIAASLRVDIPLSVEPIPVGPDDRREPLRDPTGTSADADLISE